MGLGKKLLAKARLYTRRKKDVSKEIVVKDFGDFEVKIIYSTDYLNNIIEIQPYIVFLIVIDISKEDLMKDFTDKLIPFIKTIINVKYIVKCKDNKLYCYIGLTDISLKKISEYLYPDGSDISFILSRLMRTFNDEMNNEFLCDVIPNKFINNTDRIYKEYLTPIRNASTSDWNIIHIDKIPNINGVFSDTDIMYMTNICVIIPELDHPILLDIIDTLREYFKGNSETKNFIDQMNKDAYFNIVNNTNLIDYAQHCKIIYNNINCDTYDDVDEVLEESEEIID